MRLRPTRRGYAVLAILLLAVVMAIRFGSRSLDVIVASGIVAFLVGAVQLARYDSPVIERMLPPADHAGTFGTVRLRIESSGPMLVHVVDEHPSGVDLEPVETVAVGETATLPYRLHRRTRGVYELGPLRLRLLDVFGLLARTERVESRDECVVYPSRTPIERPPWLHAFQRTTGRRAYDRDRFDSVRRYAPGDSLRDIHWASSAKRSIDRPSFVVRTYAGGRDRSSIVLAGTCPPGKADGMASALTSLALDFLDREIPTGVHLADGHLEPGTGREHRRTLLRLLARTDGGRLATADTDAGVVVRVAEDGDGVDIVPGPSTSGTFASSTVKDDQAGTVAGSDDDDGSASTIGRDPPREA